MTLLKVVFPVIVLLAPFSSMVPVAGIKVPLLFKLPPRVRVFEPAFRLAMLLMVISPLTVVGVVSVFAPPLLRVRLPYEMPVTDWDTDPL